MVRPLFASLLLLAPLTLLAGGCAWIDDTSDDNYLYKSTPHLPVTVTLVDTRTDEEVWSQDVPVGSALKLAFRRNGTHDDPYGVSVMTWRWTGKAEQAGERSGRLTVPTRDVRRIDLHYRDPVERYVPVPPSQPSPEVELVSDEAREPDAPANVDEDPPADSEPETPEPETPEQSEQPAEEAPAEEPAPDESSEEDAETTDEDADSSDDEATSDDELDLPPPPPAPGF